MRIGVVGLAHLGFAASLAQAGCRVDLIVDDPHDMLRARDLLTRVSAPLTLAVDLPEALDLCFSDAPVRTANCILLGLTPGVGAETCVLPMRMPCASDLWEIMGPDTGGYAAALASRVGAVVVRQASVHDVPLTFRVVAALATELESLLLDGAVPWEVDAAALRTGFRIGPFAAQDALGLDLVLARSRSVSGQDKLPLLARAVAEGRMGRGVGVGWFRYPGGEGPVEDPLVEDLAAEEAHFLGLTQSCPSAEQGVARISKVLHGRRNEDWARVVSCLFGLDVAEVSAM